MSTLIVTLPSNPADAGAQYTYVVTRDGSTVGAHSCVPLERLPKRGGVELGVLREVVAVVSARHLSWHQVQLPQGALGGRLLQQDGGASRLRAVLEGLLEDQLLDDVAQLHFALEPHPPKDAPVWVAVCDRNWLRAALDALQTAGLAPTRVVPEYAPGSLGDALYLQGDADDAQMVMTCRSGVSVWPVSAATAAQVHWPDAAELVAEPAVAHLGEQLFHRAPTVQHAMQHYLQAAHSSWDLAQLNLMNSGSGARAYLRWSTAWAAVLRAPHWRAARWLVLAVLVINVLGLNALAWKERSRMNAQRTAMQGILISTFPHVQVVLDAPKQMALEMASLQQANGVVSGGELESLLEAFGAALSGDHAPLAMDYNAGELRLRGLKYSAEEVTRLSNTLRPGGYMAQMDGDDLLLKMGPAR